MSSNLLGVADVSPAEAFSVGECVSHASRVHRAVERQHLGHGHAAEPEQRRDLVAEFHLRGLGQQRVGGRPLYLSGSTASTERYEPYSLHYNGSTWSIVAMPPVPGTNNLLVYDFNAIDAISPTNVWAVGDSGNNVGVGGTPTATVIEHYNGTAWSVVPSPTVGTTPYLNGVAASSASDVWAVGSDIPSGSTTPQTLTLNWNGTAWTTVSSPNAASSDLLVGASAPAGGNVWAVGYSGASGSFNPLALQTSG